MMSRLQCMDCGKSYPINALIYTCEHCGGLLDVQHDLETLKQTLTRDTFDQRLGSLDHPYRSGVWRYKELVHPDVPDELIVSKPEGNTNLYHVPKLAKWAGVDTLFLKHEGENPTGSFKDRGMTGGVTHARFLGMNKVACASTGNTSAALSSYASQADMQGIVFFENANIALGKLSQSIAYGAVCIQTKGDFDRNLAMVREVADKLGIYILNSINPFRLEGQKTIMFEMLQQLKWQVPDWVVVPGGNLGNSSSFGKGLYELYQLGLIDRMPSIAIIQASGANPLYQSSLSEFATFTPTKAQTIASAIKIGNPVNFKKAVRVLKWTDGVVEQVSDQQIMDAKAQIDRQGIGCEPASACSLAGVKSLIDKGVIQAGETVVGILTGHLLKDPDATIGYHTGALKHIQAQYPNKLHQVEDDTQAIIDVLEQALAGQTA